MWKPKNSLEALLPIYILNVIFCHGVIQYPSVDKSKIFYSFLYSIITAILFLIYFILVFLNYYNPSWVNNYEIGYYVNTTAVTCVMFVNLIVSWVYKNKTLMINSRIIKADETLDNLGVPLNTREEFIFSIKVAILWIMYLVFTSISKTISDDEDTTLLTKIIKSFTFQHGVYVNFIIDLTFCLLVKHMKIRFKSVNKTLLDIFELQHNNFVHKVETDYKWAISRRVNFERDFSEIIHKIKRIHLELRTLCRELIAIYQIPITLGTILIFFNMTSLLVFVFQVSVDSKMLLADKMFLIINLFVTIIIFSFKFIIINYICAETILEWKKTGEIIHSIAIGSKNTEFRDEIQQFSIQILQNPLKFSPCGMYDLGYYFMKDFAGFVAMQVIVTIQTSSK